MAQNTKQKKFEPGLIKKPITSTKKTVVINPTLQTVIEVLPTVEKSNMYSEYYAEMVSATNWIPPTNQLNLTEEMLVVPANNDNKTTVQKSNKFKKVKETAKQIDKSNIEIIETQRQILENMQPEFEQVPQTVERVEMFENYVNNFTPEQEKPQIKTNDYELINQISSLQPESHDDEKLEITDEKPFMRIDKTEIKISHSSDMQTIYSIGKKIYNIQQFKEYMQSIYGKILADKCKFIEFKDETYQWVSQETFKDSQGNVLFVDDILSILHEF